MPPSLQSSLPKTLQRFTEAPIIIGGCGRSGTTLLASILSCHPRIAAIGPETRIFAEGAYPADETPVDVPFNLHSLEPHLAAAPSSTRRWCEKTPRNVHAFGRICERFEGRVHLLNVVRDGRDVVCSFHPDDPRQPWISPERWVADTRAGLQSKHLPQVHTVRYEDLVQRFEETVTALSEAIGEPDPSPFLRYPEGATLTQHAAWAGRARQISASSIGRYRKPKNTLYSQALMKHPDAQDLLHRCGYQVVDGHELQGAPRAWTQPIANFPGPALGPTVAGKLQKALQRHERHRPAAQVQTLLSRLNWAKNKTRHPAIFIVGAPSSGAEVLASLLQAHPQLFVLPADAHLLQTVRTEAVPRAYAKLADSLQLEDGVLWVDPAPKNLAFAEILRSVFPQSRLLVVTQPIEEAAHSLAGRIGTEYAAKVQVRTAMARAMQVARWPNAMRVDRLQQDPRAWMQRVLRFLNLPYSADIDTQIEALGPHFQRLKEATLP